MRGGFGGNSYFSTVVPLHMSWRRLAILSARLNARCATSQALDQLISHGEDQGMLMIMDYAEGRQKEVKTVAQRWTYKITSLHVWVSPYCCPAECSPFMMIAKRTSSGAHDGHFASHPA